jgi:cytochrome c oxidase assembly protein subunit 15
MKSSNRILFFAKFGLVMMFLVIIAGSVVRMSGSGMGCPDWPKCFGYYIPPTDSIPLMYDEGRTFQKGQMVIMNDTLWVAQRDFTASSLFDRKEWDNYKKHDYAKFNATHTWTEYINRLVGAISGIPTLILFVLSIGWLIREKDRKTFWLSAAILFLLGFEAWLGKEVVDAALMPVKITVHMFGAIALVALFLVVISRHQRGQDHGQNYSGFWKAMSLGLVLMAFMQILLGTQVREAVDVVAEHFADRWNWVPNLPTIFKIHRSFSIVVVLLLIWVYLRSKGLSYFSTALKGVFGVALVEILVGVVLAYAGMPKAAQPIHLFLGILWFAFVWAFLLEVWRKATS